MVWRIVRLVVGAAVAYVAFAAWLDRYGRAERAPAAAEAIVVLGCRVNPDGRASSALATRARRAADLYRAGVAPRIVVTGGIGDHAPSEAEAARRVLIAAGIPASSIVVEDASTSTEENLAFARALTDARRIVVVSDAYHVFRAERTARKYFDDVSGVGAVSTPSARLHGALREVIAVLGYAALGRLRSLDAPAGPRDDAPRPALACLPPNEETRLRGRASRFFGVAARSNMEDSRPRHASFHATFLRPSRLLHRRRPPARGRARRLWLERG